MSALQGFVSYGPVTQTVEDAIRMLDVIRQPDWRDWAAVPPVPDDVGAPRPRIAYSRTLGYATVDRDVLAATDAAVDAMRERGWEVRDADPGFADPIGTLKPLYYGAIGYMVRQCAPGDLESMDPGLKATAAVRPTVDELYAASLAREALGRCMGRFHVDYDLLLTPQMPLAAFRAGRDFPEGRGMADWLDWNPFTYPFNLTMQPAASLPCGLTASGLPVGLQVVGPRFSDNKVLGFCRRFEDLFPFPRLADASAGPHARRDG